MRLDLDDGYTLTGATDPTFADRVTGQAIAENLPVVTFKYRPALPDAVAELRFATNRATSGRDQVTATARFLADHLVSWDVLHKGEPAELTPDVIRRVPEPILYQIENTVSKWAPKAAADLGK
jgi:hypothetical protein